MSTESGSRKSEPPPASSWAAPPEFYLDENATSRSVRQFLVGLGYTVHTPPELYGSREASSGAPDEEWLGKISRDWIVIGRDLKIYERPRELAAYRTARVKVFLLPGQARAADLVRLVKINLARICSIASTRSPGTWRLTEAGPQPYDVPESPAGRVS